MNRILLAFIMLLHVITISADNKAQLLKLDEAIEQVEKLQTKKIMKIDMLRNSLRRSANDNERMSLCYDIFNEFHVLQFDSALHYIDKVHEMAIRTGNRRGPSFSRLLFLCVCLTGNHQASQNQKGNRSHGSFHNSKCLKMGNYVLLCKCTK